MDTRRFARGFETLVCARSDGSAGPPALEPVESMRLLGQLLWAQPHSQIVI